jgi:hypothetical protein
MRKDRSLRPFHPILVQESGPNCQKIVEIVKAGSISLVACLQTLSYGG